MGNKILALDHQARASLRTFCWVVEIVLFVVESKEFLNRKTMKDTETYWLLDKKMKRK